MQPAGTTDAGAAIGGSTCERCRVEVLSRMRFGPGQQAYRTAADRRGRPGPARLELPLQALCGASAAGLRLLSVPLCCWSQSPRMWMQAGLSHRAQHSGSQPVYRAASYAQRESSDTDTDEDGVLIKRARTAMQQQRNGPARKRGAARLGGCGGRSVLTVRLGGWARRRSLQELESGCYRCIVIWVMNTGKIGGHSGEPCKLDKYPAMLSPATG